MTIVFNKHDVLDVRRKLRKSMPKAEVLLWARLKGKQLGGLKFRRQYSVGRYVVDFCCPTAKLFVEVDGETHIGHESEKLDADRQRAIEAVGFKVIRFWNTEVYNNIEGVLQRIFDEAGQE